MTKNALKRKAVSALAIAALGVTAAVVTAPSVQAYTWTDVSEEGLDAFELVVKSFATEEEATEAATTIISVVNQYGLFTGVRLPVFAIDSTDLTKGYGVYGRAELQSDLDEQQRQEAITKIKAALSEADAAADASWGTQPSTPDNNAGNTDNAGNAGDSGNAGSTGDTTTANQNATTNSSKPSDKTKVLPKTATTDSSMLTKVLGLVSLAVAALIGLSHKVFRRNA